MDKSQRVVKTWIRKANAAFFVPFTHFDDAHWDMWKGFQDRMEIGKQGVLHTLSSPSPSPPNWIPGYALPVTIMFDTKRERTNPYVGSSTRKVSMKAWIYVTCLAVSRREFSGGADLQVTPNSYSTWIYGNFGRWFSVYFLRLIEFLKGNKYNFQ